MKDRKFRKWYNATWRKSAMMNTDGTHPPAGETFPDGSKCVYHRWIEGIMLGIILDEAEGPKFPKDGPAKPGADIEFKASFTIHPNYCPDPNFALLLAKEFISILTQHFERFHFEYDSETQALIGTPRKEEVE